MQASLKIPIFPPDYLQPTLTKLTHAYATLTTRRSSQALPRGKSFPSGEPMK